GTHKNDFNRSSSPGFGGLNLNSLWHEFISNPLSMSNSPAEAQYQEFVVTCCTPTISRADLPSRKKPGTRNAQLPASKIKDLCRRDDLLCSDIQHSCLSWWRAEEDLGLDYELLPRIGAGINDMSRELLLRSTGDAHPSSAWHCAFV